MKKILVVIFVLIILSVALAAWWNLLTWNRNIFNWFSKPQTAQQIKQTTDQTAGWKTYSNLGFDLKYPSDNFFAASNDIGEKNNPGIYATPISVVEPSVDCNFNLLSKNLSRCPDLKDPGLSFYSLSKGVVTSNGIDYCLYEGDGAKLGYNFTGYIYVTAQNNACYYIIFGVPKSKNKNQQAVIDQIFSTFKFEKQAPVVQNPVGQTTDWNTYADLDKGYEIKIPTDFISHPDLGLDFPPFAVTVFAQGKNEQEYEACDNRTNAAGVNTGGAECTNPFKLDLYAASYFAVPINDPTGGLRGSSFCTQQGDVTINNITWSKIYCNAFSDYGPVYEYDTTVNNKYYTFFVPETNQNLLEKVLSTFKTVSISDKNPNLVTSKNNQYGFELKYPENLVNGDIGATSLNLNCASDCPYSF